MRKTIKPGPAVGQIMLIPVWGEGVDSSVGHWNGWVSWRVGQELRWW